MVEEEERKTAFNKVSCQEPVSICFSSLGAQLLCGQQSCKSEILWDGIDDTAKYEHCIWVVGAFCSMHVVCPCNKWDNLWTDIHMCWSEVQRPCFGCFHFFFKGCTKMRLGEVNLNGHVFQIEIFVKWPPFGPFFHLLTLLSIFKHWYSSQK